MHPHENVLQHRHVRKEPDVLKRSADACAGDLLGLQANQGTILEADLPRIRAVNARQSIEERGLTRAVRSDQRGDHSLFQFKTHTRERLQAAEPLGYVAEFQQ